MTTWSSTRLVPAWKTLTSGTRCRLFQPADRVALLVRARIAFAGHHHADGRSRVPLERRDLVEPAVDGGFEDIEQVALQPHQQRLAFRVAETDVEFEHLAALVGHHQAGVEDAAEGPPRSFHLVHGGDQDLLLDRCQQSSVTSGVGQ